MAVFWTQKVETITEMDRPDKCAFSGTFALSIRFILFVSELREKCWRNRNIWGEKTKAGYHDEPNAWP